ncbi:putative low-complexity protein [Saccharomonospora marina XMU15]|uniref:Putative low-complexity protein n=1 Tax=Saccharomonospora marina XMU15 TaxID=882083 RepID=H5X3V4_9PSEU|nr:pentapeptide repeat-containing protein [Saccharomonospora marina]EHR52172.1 putative low-complexity protein [Saccharomonospora marina XMU15]
MSRQHSATSDGDDLEEELEADLRADCANCFGLCCVALPFAAGADFAVDKPAGSACHNLAADFRCGIHSRLRAEGYPGCVAFDCFGAGQKVSKLTFGGQDWRGDSARARRMFDTFTVMRQLHEVLRYLTEALRLPAARPIHDELRRARAELWRATLGDVEELLALDVAALRERANTLLLRASELARCVVPGRKPDHRGADLTGARLRGARLAGASLRGASLLAADLTDADLRVADFTGADLRGADLSGADLEGSLFLTQPQLQAANGNEATRLPTGTPRPSHW